MAACGVKSWVAARLVRYTGPATVDSPRWAGAMKPPPRSDLGGRLNLPQQAVTTWATVDTPIHRRPTGLPLQQHGKRRASTTAAFGTIPVCGRTSSRKWSPNGASTRHGQDAARRCAIYADEYGGRRERLGRIKEGCSMQDTPDPTTLPGILRGWPGEQVETACLVDPLGTRAENRCAAN